MNVKMKNHFALIGAAGYIAPRHMKAIKETGGELVCALDPFDSVGIIDSYFPQADFFTEPERFDRHLDKLRRRGTPVDYVSICSPNYLHDAHIRMALRNECNVICEKPLVLSSKNARGLMEIERETGKRVYTILQLRHHPEVVRLKEQIKDKHYKVDLRYITPRGKWYGYSWKGDKSKSGGVATNIGIHFFDMLQWVFGDLIMIDDHSTEQTRAFGTFIFQRATVNWFLSIDPQDSKTAYRSILIDGQEFDFSNGFTDLHTVSYQAILDGHGFGIQEAIPSIHITEKIR